MASHELPDDMEDIDAGDEEDPCISIYAKDIYRHLTEMELEYPIEENFLSKQVQITAVMRAKLIDWLVDIQALFSLVIDTFHLTIGIIDRYLQVVPDLHLSQLKLVGITAMWIACKYEETFEIKVADLIKISKISWSKKDIFRCELDILTKLGFCLGRPIPCSFLKRFQKAAHGSTKDGNLANYLVDLSLMEGTMAHYRSSELAAAATFLSLSLLSNKQLKEVWTPTLTYYSGYTSEHLLPTVKKMSLLAIEVTSSNFKAVYRKYSDIKFDEVATLTTTAAFQYKLSQIINQNGSQ